MPSELDIKLQAIMGRLTAPGGPFETAEVDHFGRRLPVFRHAPTNLPALFAEFCGRHHDREFLVDGDIRLTFGEVHAMARHAAIGLIEEHGMRQGDHVGIAGANSASWIIGYMAVLMAGGCATLLNAWWTGDELAQAVELAECKLVLADKERAARLDAFGTPARVLAFGGQTAVQHLAALVAAGGHRDTLPAMAGTDAATIVFTSGTTGEAKAAFSDHRAVVHVAMTIAAQAFMIATEITDTGAPLPEESAALLCVPLFHVTGEIAVLLASFVSGRKLVIMPKWSAAEAMRLIEAERITFFTGVPLMSHEIATHPDRARYDLSSCTFFAAGGSAQPADHVHTILESIAHAFPLQGYGLTESNCVGCTNFTRNYLAKPGSTGPAHRPLVEIRVLGPDGEGLAAGEDGEVAIRSICNFGGYWNDPEATAETIRSDGFLLTGDLGHLDTAGYLFIVDRKKDIIIRGGENIAAIEVERAIYSHPGVAEASVFGLPDDRYGEVPVAVYHAKQGECLDARELQRHLAERIAAFKIPVQFWEQDQALPRLAAEKVDKRRLRDRYAKMWAGAKG